MKNLINWFRSRRERVSPAPSVFPENNLSAFERDACLILMGRM